MIWHAERIGRNGARLWRGADIKLPDRAEFVQWVRACCLAAGMAERARRQVDLPKVWRARESFLLRNYSAIGEIGELRFTQCGDLNELPE